MHSFGTGWVAPQLCHSLPTRAHQHRPEGNAVEDIGAAP